MMCDLLVAKIDKRTVCYSLTKNNVIVREYKIEDGRTYLVDHPDQGYKHQGKRVIVIGFIEPVGLKDQITKVRVKLLPNMRNGVVDVCSLVDENEIKENEEKLKEARENELRMLISKAENEISILNKKIDEYRLEMVKLR